jgi:hypothetical protein
MLMLIRKKLIKDFNIDVASDDADFAYCSWMVCLFLLINLFVVLFSKFK